MKKIRFAVNGLLMGLEFKEGSNIEVEAEQMLANKTSFIEEVTGARVVSSNRNFFDGALETTVRDGEIDGYVERHVGYKYTLEKEISDSLQDKDIKMLIFNTDIELERKLCSEVNAINADCEEEFLEFQEYAYQII